jgi:hypothetical protein
MTPKFNIYTFGTFGNPNGYNHNCIYKSQQQNYLNSSFDLNTNAIKLFPDTKVFSIKKGQFQNQNTLVFSYYSHALEINSNRDGTFIGCSIVFLENYIEIAGILKFLAKYTSFLKDEHTTNSKLRIKHSNEFGKPSYDFKNLISSNQKLYNIPRFDTKENQQKLFVYYRTDDIEEILNEATTLLDYYSEIYFSSNNEIAAFVKEKNLYTIKKQTKDQPNLSRYIDQIKKEKSEKIEQQKRNILLRKEDSQHKINQLQTSIEIHLNRKQQEKKSIDSDTSKLESSHSELQRIKKDLSSSFEALLNGIENSSLNLNLKKESSLIQSYTNQLNEISDFIERLNSNGRRNDDARNGHIPKSRVKTSLEVDQNNDGFGYNIFEYVSIFLGVLLIGSWCYFLFFYEPDIPENYTRQKEIQGTGGGQSVQEFLNESDLSIVNKKLKRGMTLDTIVSIVFKNNPNDIESHYSSKKEIYKDLLINSNEDLFKKVNLDYILDADALKKVPCKK